MGTEDKQTVQVEIGTLADLDLATLRIRWRDLYRSDPPAHMSRQVLVQAIAYRLQEKTFGGLSRSARMKLTGAKKEQGKRPATSRCASIQHRIKPGTRLLREWQGRPHEVIAIDGGRFLYREQTYTSLSAIAREITGTRWSGPTFFGLNKKTGG